MLSPKLPRNQKNVAALAESLESRRLLAVTVTTGKFVITVNGTSGNDNIVASISGSNLKVKLDATHTFTASSGAVRTIKVNLGAGNDKFTADNSVKQVMDVDGNFGKDTITTGGGKDHIFSGNENDQVNGGDGDDSIEGGSGDDNLSGDGGADTISDGTGSDKVFGGSGKDVLKAQPNPSGADRYDGGDGDDLLSYSGRTAGVAITNDGVANDGKRSGSATTSTEKDNVLPNVEEFTCTEFNDFLKLTGNVKNYIVTLKGADQIDSGPGNDTVSPGDGDDIVNGGSGNDSLRGGNGIDVINAGEGNDSAAGGDGADVVLGGSGNDTVEGNPGDDIILGESGKDIVLGGSGNDNLDGGDGDDQIFGEDGNDTLEGGDNNDILNGGAGFDKMFGSGGVDQIFAQDNVFGETVDGGADGDIAFIDKINGIPLDNVIRVESF